jgi:hypothetical protein
VTRTSALLAIALGLSGCFYSEDINQRPSIDIIADGKPVFRGDHVALRANPSDPEGQVVSFSWRAYACTDGVGGADCDAVPFYTGELIDAAFDVPLVRVDNGLPDINVRVVLEAEDEYGATAKPSQELVIVALDRPPEVTLHRDGNFIVTPERSVIIYATVGDLDDGPVAIGTPVWTVFAQPQVASDLTDVAVTQNPNDPAHRTYAKQFVPHGTGDFEIRVTSTDPLDVSTMTSEFIHVEPPPPPCLAQVAPIVPPAGVALPITQPTLFAVSVVVDDLDVFPAQPGDPDLGVTRFQWSLQGPGGSVHTPVAGATANSFAVDPATFTPGDIVEVRVEIYDRENTPIPCPDGDATCSTISMQSCIQRQTWRVEVR